MQATIQQNHKAILWMIFYAAIISGMHVCIRLVSEGMHPLQIVFFRNVFGLIAVIPWFIKFGFQPLKTERFGLLFFRGGLNSLAMFGFFYSVAILPLAEVTALSFTAPIFATLLAIFVFNEKLGVWRWAAIIFGLIGVFVVLRPGFNEINYGQILCLLSALGWSGCLIIIKILGRTESAATIATYMSIIMAPLTLVPAIFFWTSPNLEQILMLILLGTLGGIGQLAMTESLRLGETHIVTPFDFSRLIFISIFGYFLFEQVPDIYVWIGGSMIIISIAFIAWREHVQTNPKSTGLLENNNKF